MAAVSEVREPVIIEVSSPVDCLLAQRNVKGEIEDFANRLLTLAAGEEIALSSGITVRSKDLLFMGEVVRCVPGPDQTWEVGVRVRRAILVV